jgi:hypothetical protein
MLLAAATGALAFWVLTAVTRAGFAEPAASRYLYVGAVFILLICAEAGLGLGIRAAWLALAGLLALGALVANIGLLRAGERGLRASDTSVRASLAAVQIAAPVVSPSFEPDPTNAPQLTAAPYLTAGRDLGSPAFTVAELERAPESVREHADAVLERAERLAATPSSGGPASPVPLTVESVYGASVRVRGGCAQLVPTGALASLDLRLSPGAGVLARPSAAAKLYVRRFASILPGAPFATVQPGAHVSVHFPQDRAPQLAWHLQLVTPGPALVCGITGSG